MALELDGIVDYRTWHLSERINKDRLPHGQPGFTSALHMKTLLVDNAVYLGGSFNWSLNSEVNMVEHLEVTQLNVVIKKMAAMHSSLWEESVPLSDPQKKDLVGWDLLERRKAEGIDGLSGLTEDFLIEHHKELHASFYQQEAIEAIDAQLETWQTDAANAELQVQQADMVRFAADHGVPSMAQFAAG